MSALRLVADPLAGPAAVRLLTGAALAAGRRGPRRALGPRPRAGAGAVRLAASSSAAELALGALPGEHAEQAGLVDALDDPGEPGRYSAGGLRADPPARRGAAPPAGAGVGAADGPRRRHRASAPARRGDRRPARSRSAGRTSTRSPTSSPTSPRAPRSPRCRRCSTTSTPPSVRKTGSRPARSTWRPDRVQVLTVHAAKGLEWEIVAVPHLVAQVFPGPQDQRELADRPRPRCPSRCAATPRTCRGSSCPLPGRGPQGRRGGLHRARRGARRAAAGRGAAAVLRRGHPGRARAAAVRAPVGPDRRAAAAAVGVPAWRPAQRWSPTGVGRVEHWAQEPEFGVQNPATAETGHGRVAGRPARRPVRRRARRGRAGARGAAGAGSGRARARPAESGAAERHAVRPSPTTRPTRRPGRPGRPRGLGRRRRRAARRARRRGSAPGRRAARAAVGQQARRAGDRTQRALALAAAPPAAAAAEPARPPRHGLPRLARAALRRRPAARRRRAARRRGRGRRVGRPARGAAGGVPRVATGRSASRTRSRCRSRP